jgi:alpha-glucosidase
MALRPNTRPWSLSRSGYAGIQRYAANWSGDTNSTFDSLRVSVQITNQMGLSGQNQFGHDIGGFLGAPSAELFIRWLEFGSYLPLFRNHAINTSTPREPYAFGEPYTTMARNIINQRYQMLPYFYALEENASTEGAPVVAPLLYYFPSDANTYTQDQEFMLGPWLLVAPVSQEGATSLAVYLPAGANWIDLYTDSTYAGGQQITAQAPLERIPVFVREGAIIPRGPVVQYVTQPVAPAPTLDFYPGPNSEFTIYEDDGASFNYQNGVFLRTSISRAQQAGSTKISIVRTQGTWVPPLRTWTLYFHNAAMPKTVTLNGSSILYVASAAVLNTSGRGWTFNSANGQLIVRVPDSAQALSISIQ